MKIYLYIAAMALTTYLIRALPLTLIRRPIRSVFLRSFLYYVLIGIVSAWFGLGLLPVSLLCCGSVICLQFLF